MVGEKQLLKWLVPQARLLETLLITSMYKVIGRVVYSCQCLSRQKFSAIRNIHENAAINSIPYFRVFRVCGICWLYKVWASLLGIHTEETRSERDTCTPMFIAALFIIARTWKQPRCPSADECIRKLWYIYTMEYYSATKKNTVESVLMRWMKLELIIQSEVSQKGKHQYSVLMHIYGI